MELADLFRALANEKRLQVLEWLKDPVANFPPQVHGDLIHDGVCGIYLADKLGIGHPTLSEHMRVLVRAGLVTPTRIKQWTFYRRNDARISELTKAIKAAV